MTTQSTLEHWADEDVLREVKRLAGRERQATVELIAALMELDARRLYLGEGCSSLFSYCTRVLHLSEHAAYGRIEAARAARRFPVILDLLAEGSLNLTAVGLLAPHLTPENQRELLDAARHGSKREVEHLIARLRPEPPVPSSVRKLPAAKEHQAPVAQCEPEPLRPDLAGSAISNRPSPPSRPAIVQPLAPERYKIQFTVGRETYERLLRAQDLLRHAIRNGDPAAIFDRALTLLVADLERRKLGVTVRPRSCRAAPRGSRYIPAAIRRAVWTRDGGRCAFVGTHGRCAETGFLEFHHVVPYAAGGQATVDNLELRCAAHNAYEAAQFFAQEPVLLKEEVGPVYSHGYSVRTESANAKGRSGVTHRRYGGQSDAGAITSFVGLTAPHGFPKWTGTSLTPKNAGHGIHHPSAACSGLRAGFRYRAASASSMARACGAAPLPPAVGDDGTLERRDAG